VHGKTKQRIGLLISFRICRAELSHPWCY